MDELLALIGDDPDIFVVFNKDGYEVTNYNHQTKKQEWKGKNLKTLDEAISIVQGLKVSAAPAPPENPDTPPPILVL